MRKKEEIFISHVLFPWETFAAQAEREQRERKNGGARWTESFRKEVRENILRYANTDFFERLTQSRGTLGAFLRSLPVLSGPWDDEFHRRRCAFCTRENCDECPNEEERGNPAWWLSLEAEEVKI